MIQFPKEIIEQYETTKPAYQKVYNILRDSILNGLINPDKKLTEIAVSQALDVSRTPVRAALQQLKNDGILPSGQKRGTSVKQLSRKDREDLLLFSCYLEGYAAKLAAKEQDLELFDTLEEILNRSEELNKKYNLNYEEAPGLRDLSFQFHTILAKASKNKYLYKTIVEIRTLMRMHSAPREVVEQTGGRVALDSFRRNVLKALRAGDGDGAKMWIQVDIYSGRDMYINAQIT